MASALLGLSLPARGQPPRVAAPAPARPPAPTAAPAAVDALFALKLVWSTMAALDQANRTGNYSVLRDLGAPDFQTANSAAALSALFQNFRAQQVDVGNALIVSPVYDFAPAIVQGGLLRLRGVFPLRPAAIAFDLLFQQVNGQWRIFGIAVAPVAAATATAIPQR